ncbi:MAG: PQQ-dependent sugar dehydrogenase [Acidimicrobiia bacterium]
MNRKSGRSRHAIGALVATLALGTASAAVVVPAAHAAIPAFADPKFSDTVMIGGAAAPGTLDLPIAVRFAPDGRVFVAEQTGVVKEFDSLTDPTPTTVLDISAEVMRSRDRGLLGLALDPNFPTKPYLYVSYTYNHDPFGSKPAPTWPTWGCDDHDGCTAEGRLSRFLVGPGNVAGPEEHLITDWCQQYDSHSMGAINFGADGYLYLSAGEGAYWGSLDYGQLPIIGALDGRTPPNPCNDPPAGRGTSMLFRADAQGGSLRAQSVRRPAGPILLSGTVVRVDPDTGDAAPGNPNGARTSTGQAAPADSTNPASVANLRRIVGFGFRNPYRFTIRPGTNDLWIGDVGNGTWEEIDRIANPTGSVGNFGWPCYEGAPRNADPMAGQLYACTSLYGQGAGAVASPVYAYRHDLAAANSGPDTCPVGGNGAAVSAISFYTGTSYPAKYRGALFFGDYVRNCLWAMLPGANGLPDPTRVETFETNVGTPVDLEIGPGGDLYYVDIGVDMSVSPPRTDLGAIHRIAYSGAANAAPTARITADATSGATPLTVHFSGSTSTDPEHDPLTYAWDLDGDGTYETGNVVAPSHTYSATEDVTVGLRVTDTAGNTTTATTVIHAGNSAPKVTITSPAAPWNWKVGDPIDFSGGATDQQDGTLPASALHWTLLLHHCHGGEGCHIHTEAHLDGAASGTFLAPDHETGSYLELVLETTDSGGLPGTASVVLQPRTATVTVATDPPGLPVTADGNGTGPFTQAMIVGHTATISAPLTSQLGGVTYHFDGWSDGGPATRVVVVTQPMTITARYHADPATQPRPAGPVVDAATAGRAADGYRLVASDGGIFSFGSTRFFGSAAGRAGAPIVGMAATPSGDGYWMAGSDGSVYAFGDARPLGGRAGAAGAPIVGIAATPSGQGYWLAAADGSVFAFGSAANRGSLAGKPLAKPVVGIAATPSGNGYWLLATDGGIFSFGDAAFHGSTGAIRLNRPIVGMAPTGSGHGYDLVASDGGIFSFGDAVFHGSTGAMRLNRPVVGMQTTPSGRGYWLVASDGGIFSFGDAVFHGSTGAIRLNRPITGMG